MIICGDFNTHYNNECCKVTYNLAQLIDQCGFQQSVQSPTHARGNTLDLIITPLRSNILVSKPRITVQISDHFVVECYVNFKKPRSHTHTLTYRKYHSIDSEHFSSDLLSATQYVDTMTDFNKRYVDTITDFNTSVQSVLDAHAPFASRVVTERNHQPWQNRSITEAKRRIRRRERKHSSQFRRARNVYSDLLYKT